ncbi:MAG: hypothetical protein CMJ58_27450 [Planctomycetaceae bacterium]|nr:hypothetical protein [Planctomycetaceae bacterium]
MIAISRQFVMRCVGASLLGLLVAPSAALAQSVVPAHLNGWTLLSNDFSAQDYGDFSYAGAVVGASSLGPFTAFTFDDPDFNGGGAGYANINDTNAPFDQASGLPVEPVDFSFTDAGGVTAFDILNRGSFGGNFNPNEYVIEVLYKTGPNNTAPSFNVMLEQWDGFNQDAGATFGQRQAEQLQWGSFQSGTVPEGGIAEYYNDENNPRDADGFAILRIPMSVAPQFTGQSFLFNNGDTAYAAPGDGTADLDAFEDRVPNGFGQIHLQAPFNSDNQRLEIEVKDIRIVPALRNPTVVARFDAKSGIGLRFGTPFNADNGGGEFVEFDHDNDNDAATPTVLVLETNQVQRFDANGFTNLIINTDDDLNLGGVGMWQDHHYQTFDATTATLNFTAKLTANNTAEFVDVVINELDGQDDAAGAGGEEYKYYIDLSQLNDTSFTTISIPMTNFDERAQSFGTNNDGDMSLEDFNPFYLGLLARQGGGLVGLEIESIQVTVPVAASGDVNQDGAVDGDDFLALQRNFGGGNGRRAVLDAGDADFDGDIDADDLMIWRVQYGAGPGLAASSASRIPEPTAVALALIGCVCLSRRLRHPWRTS